MQGCTFPISASDYQLDTLFNAPYCLSNVHNFASIKDSDIGESRKIMDTGGLFRFIYCCMKLLPFFYCVGHLTLYQTYLHKQMHMENTHQSITHAHHLACWNYDCPAGQ